MRAPTIGPSAWDGNSIAVALPQLDDGLAAVKRNTVSIIQLHC